jgi:hypothetical protein
MTNPNDDPLPEVNDSSLPLRITKDTLVQEFDRPRGIFTEVDRRFLSGFKEYEYKQSATNRRQGIRERIVHAFHDFRLFNWLSEREREKVFNEIPAGGLHDDLVSLMAFVYRGLGRDRDAVEAIEQIIQSAIFRVEGEENPRKGYYGGVADVSVEINLERGYDAEEIYRRFERGDPEQLTPAEIGVLIRADMLDSEGIEQLKTDPDSLPTGTGPSAGRPWYLSQEEQAEDERE